MKISFHSYAKKANFRVKRFALSLAFIMRFTATRKWPICFDFVLILHYVLNLTNSFAPSLGSAGQNYRGLLADGLGTECSRDRYVNKVTGRNEGQVRQVRKYSFFQSFRNHDRLLLVG